MAASTEDSSEFRYSSVRDSVKSKTKKAWKEVTVGPRQFKIRGPLGKGGFSEVYAGEDSETGKRVALKMMFEVQEDETTYKQTCDEIKMMRKLNHTNLIKLLGYDLHAEYRNRKCVILVQELAPNRELFEYLLHSRKTFSEQLVMYIGHQIFSAIRFMHEKGIAHRDLKPENILLDKEFRLKIADFGFAKFFRKNDQAIKMRTQLGTRGYMAPEISANSHIPRANRTSYDEKVDIFALGVIMFICFAGFPPFRQTNNEDWWFDKIMKKEWNYFWRAHERKAKFSDKSKDLLQHMLAKDAADRWTISECLKSDFIVNNGKMMEKDEYNEEMKSRYKYVKAAIRKAKDSKASHGKRDIKGALQNPEMKKKLDSYTDFIPAPVLCANDIRLAIYNAPEQDCLQQCVEACAKTFVGLPPKAYHDCVEDLKATLGGYETNDLKNVLCNCTEAEDLSFLKEVGVEPEKLLEILNECIIGKDVPVPIDGDNSLAQYVTFDSGYSLDLFDPEEFENTPNAFHVKFGLGTFIHLIRQYATNIEQVEDISTKDTKKTIQLVGVSFDDFESGKAVVTYEIVEKGKIDDEEFSMEETLSVEVKLWQLLPKYVENGTTTVVIEGRSKVEAKFVPEDVPGFALTVRHVQNSDSLSMAAGEVTYVFEKLLKESELTELCY